MDICWACCTINTETSTYVPTKCRFSVALLYLSQCPFNPILSKCLSLFVQFNQSLQNVNWSQFRFLHCGGLWTDEQKAQLDNSLAMFLEAGIKKTQLGWQCWSHITCTNFGFALWVTKRAIHASVIYIKFSQIWLPCNVWVKFKKCY